MKNLVELHGGSVRVKSPGENQGSSFIVALPVSHLRSERKAASNEGHAVEQQPLENIELPRLDGARILIVDDEADGRAIIARIIEGQGRPLSQPRPRWKRWRRFARRDSTSC